MTRRESSVFLRGLARFLSPGALSESDWPRGDSHVLKRATPPSGFRPEPVMMKEMSVATLISLEEYLHTSYHPDCDFIDGEVLERNVGKREHSYAQGRTIGWFLRHQQTLLLEPMPEMRVQVGSGRVRIPDVVVSEMPIPNEPVFTSPSYLYVEVMSPEDTMAGLQDRVDEYLKFGVPNIWVLDPWKHRGWRVTEAGWATATDGIMRTADGKVAMPLQDVLLP